MDKIDEKRVKDLLHSQAQRAIDLRSKEREFHGVEREFRYYQKKMMEDFDRSKDIKHPRDLGDAREEILRSFLKTSGFVPDRYGISQNKVRVASGSGHVSPEMDILFYDPDNALRLMRREGGYEVLPAESVYGAIQVKSRLNKGEIKDGLQNLASFKGLKRDVVRSGGVERGDDESDRFFGLLFAYDSDLEWLDIIREIESFAQGNDARQWTNAVFILSRGTIIHGDVHAGYKLNAQLDHVSKLQMYGLPDREGLLLYEFMGLILLSLENTTVARPKLYRYFRLPSIAGQQSYSFSLGQFSEFGSCERHGDFSRKISEESLAKVVSWCRETQPMNWIRATDLAYGKTGDNEEAYARQPGDVYIYNPEWLSLEDILVSDGTLGGRPVKSLAFDSIDTAGMTIYIPFYYTAKEGIVSGCPKCQTAPRRRRAPRPG